VRRRHIGKEEDKHRTWAGSGDGLLAAIEKLAYDGDKLAFHSLVATLDWEAVSAMDSINLIRLALRVGAHLEARQLSERALTRHPGDPDLRKLNRLLSPPRIISSTLPPTADIEANRGWLKEHSAQYAGRWVALRAGELLATGSSANQVIGIVGDISGVLITIAS
jgi:hypothetical protein